MVPQILCMDADANVFPGKAKAAPPLMKVNRLMLNENENAKYCRIA
jgi:hypothetical protein